MTEGKLRVVVTMTTIPSRIDNISQVVDNLLAQTYAFDKLCLYVPDVCARQDLEYKIPDCLFDISRRDPRFVVRKIATDYGPATKILPAMIEFGVKNTVLISVDDDVILEEHAIEELMAAYVRLDKDEECILGFMGCRNAKNGATSFHHAEHVREDMCDVDALGGYRAVLYAPQISQQFIPLLERLHAEQLRKVGRPIMDDDHALQLCAVHCETRRAVVRTKYLCYKDTPETRMVPFLNIRFISNTDGVSAAKGNNDKKPVSLIDASRDVTQHFFHNLQ
jgi:hypothetical protein